MCQVKVIWGFIQIGNSKQKKIVEPISYLN